MSFFHSTFAGGSIETVENKNGIEMQGVENGHAAPSRGSSRPSHQEEAAEGDEDDDDEIYEPPVKSYMYNLFRQKTYTISFLSIYLISKLRHKKERNFNIHLLHVYEYIMPYYIFPIHVFFCNHVRQMHVDKERMINYIAYNMMISKLVFFFNCRYLNHPQHPKLPSLRNGNHVVWRNVCKNRGAAHHHQFRKTKLMMMTTSTAIPGNSAAFLTTIYLLPLRNACLLV